MLRSVFVLAMTGLLFTVAVCAGAVAQERPPSPVVTARVIEKEVRGGQTFVGTVLPEQRAVIGSAVDGRVVEYPVKEGDRVEAKQVLAQLLTETISLEIEAAEAELRLRQEELEELRNGTRPEEIEQARAQMVAAQTALELAKKRRERIHNLYTSGNAATQEQYDEALAAVDNAQAVLEERTAAHELAVAGPRKEHILQADARVAMQRAVVERLKDQRTKHTMISRFAGYVVTEHTEIGEWVNRGDPVAEVIALDRVDVLAHVLENHVPHIRQGMESRVQVTALPEKVFTGQVRFLVPQGDQRSRTFPIKVRVENEFVDEHPVLNSGMQARVTLPTGPVKTARLTPKDAIVLGGPRPVVYVVDIEDPNAQTGTVQPVPVDLGVASGALIEVIGDVEVGALVVVQGNERLRPGQPVRITREIAATE